MIPVLSNTFPPKDSSAAVDSVAGTANQINASPNTGSVVLTLSSTIVTPGTLAISGNTASSFVYSDASKNLVTTGAPTNGQLLIGSTGSVPVAAALTQGAGITITNAAGSITVANAGVTSNVAGTGISVSGATGAVTVTNTGVISAVGTNNQIAVSGSTGAITYSTPLPANIVFPILGSSSISQYLNLGGGVTGWVDDFMGTGSVTVNAAISMPGDSQWSAAPVAGTTGTVTGQPATFQNPGQFVITTPATTGDGVMMYKGGGSGNGAPLGIIGNAANWQLDFWFQTPATITNDCIRVGYCIFSGQAADPPTAGSWLESDTANVSNKGGMLSHGAITGGSSYTNGTYTNVPITGGTGSGALATVVVSGGAVTTVTFTTAGLGYLAADTGLSASAANIGGTGSGFTFGLSTVTQNWNFRTVNASTSTYNDTGITLIASTFYHVIIYSTVAGSLNVYLGAANAIPTSVLAGITSNVDTTHAMLPWWGTVPRANTLVKFVGDRSSYIGVTGRN